ncbi:cation:proton antiporter [Amycolatopsis sp. EV170708-02-1]|uniref:cation:proton antiporter n=1 Tax=Amycolatopsis sp. EV170708-02-1 TaxID=2919322 RepID=UPI001F0B7BB5|nr:cation:proton antiporter [Amycolatopsis sp. EV170708-02-1]UMP00012.1 cation:proton antiporter [Amycolatopsis sp. EV170708-02-1]
MSAAELNVRILLAVVVILIGVRAVGWLFGRFGQPRVLGEIVAGIVLGPSVLGLLQPAAMAFVFPGPVIDSLRVLAQFGLVIFMFLLGLDLDLGKLRGSGRTVTVVANASVLVPFALGAGFAVLIWPRFGAPVDPAVFYVFLGATMSVTAFPVLARLLQESELAKERVGVISLVCAAINDLAAWILVGVVAALAGSFGDSHATRSLAFAAAFVACMLMVVRPLLRRWGEPPVWAVLVIALLSAWATEQIGVHAIIGGFVAGLVMPRRPEWQSRLSDRIGVVVSNLLLPLFFAVVGLSTRIDQLSGAGLLLLAGAVVVAIAGKLGGSAIAARLTGETRRDALTIGILMNTRGITEIVMLTTGLQLGIISTTVFTVMVLMALVTTVMAAPALRIVRRPPETPRKPPLRQSSPTGAGRPMS